MSVAIIINNYLHDVATAVLLASGVIMWVLGVRARDGGPAVRGYFAQAYHTLTRLALGAIVWIVIGGIPRTIFFTTYEWDPAVTRGIVPALVVKHVLMVGAIVAGGFVWLHVRRIALGEGPSSQVGEGAA